MHEQSDDRPGQVGIEDLTEVEVRVLGCFVEKEATTPDSYPLTTNSLVSACNQKTSRDPVVQYTAVDVDKALMSLRERGLVRAVHQSGDRSTKHRHVLDEALDLSGPQVAVLAVLFLRSAQTPGELRGRTERIHQFDSPAEVEAVLERLAARGFLQQLDRAPGHKECRWQHLLSSAIIPVETSAHAGTTSPAPAAAPTHVQATPSGGGLAGELAEVRAELADLSRRFDALCELLGEHPE